MGILDFFKVNKYKKFSKELKKDIKKNIAINTSIRKLNDVCKADKYNCYKYKKIFFNLYKDIDTNTAIKYAEDVLKYEKDLKFIRVLASRYRKIGKYEKSKELLYKFIGKYYDMEEIIYFDFVNILKFYKTEEEIKKEIELLKKEFLKFSNLINNYAFSYLKDTNEELALSYGIEYYKYNPFDAKFNKVFFKRINKSSNFVYKNKFLDLNNKFQYIKQILNNYLEFNKSKFEKDLKIIYHKTDGNVIKIFINKVIEKFPNFSERVYKSSFLSLKEIAPELSLEYFNKYRQISQENLTKIKKIEAKLDKNIKLKNESKLLKSRKFDSNLFKKELEKYSKKYSSEFEEYILMVTNKFKKRKNQIYKITFSILKDSNVNIAIKYGLLYFDKNKDDIKFIIPLIKRLERVNEQEVLYSVAKEAYKLTNDDILRDIVVSYDMKEDIEELFKSFNKNNLKKLEKKYFNNLFSLYRMVYKKFIDIDYNKALFYINKALEIKSNEYVLKDLYDLNIKYGYLYKAKEAIPNNPQLNTLKIKKANIDSFIDLYENGFNIPIKDIKYKNYNSKKIFYLLHNRLPYNSGGYATRSHGLLTGAFSYGWDMNGVSRLGYPWDKMPDKPSNEFDIIENIKYFRLIDGDIGLGKLPLKNYLVAYANSLLELSLKEKPALIHAASNYMNGIVGNYVAKSLGIKSIYEVRGLWELTRISRQPEWKNTEYYNLMAKMETEAAKNADIVITITHALKDEMVRRGVDASKIEILPNGVVTERFKPLKKDLILQKELGIEGKSIIGFIGSFVQYEGLEYIVDAVEILVKKGITNICALMVGDGAVWQDIVDRVKDKNLDEYFIFTGRIPHKEVERYYSLVDISPLPRKGLPVCEMVSPLKPFEAMAMEKVVLSSDVAALAEIVQDGYNGMLFKKDNVEDLADKLELLINDEVLRENIGRQAREWVIKERDWSIITDKLNKIYSKLLNENI